MAGIGDFPMMTVLRAENFDRARAFYTDILGLTEQPVEGPTSESTFTAGDGTRLTIYERPGMPAPENTALAFGVPAERFDEVVADLRSRGVVMEEYDLPEIGLKTVNGIVEFDGNKSAWFKDSEGNILTVGSM